MAWPLLKSLFWASFIWNEQLHFGVEFSVLDLNWKSMNCANYLTRMLYIWALNSFERFSMRNLQGVNNSCHVCNLENFRNKNTHQILYSASSFLCIQWNTLYNAVNHIPMGVFNFWFRIEVTLECNFRRKQRFDLLHCYDCMKWFLIFQEIETIE